FFDDVRRTIETGGGRLDVDGPEPPADAENPSNRATERYPWPTSLAADELAARESAAGLVRAATEAGWQRAKESADDALMLDEQAQVAEWDAEMGRLIEEARRDHAAEVEVDLPATLSATTMLRLQDDPDG